MKLVIKKDLKEILPSRVMMVISFILLECILLAGLGLKNSSLVSTCLIIMILLIFISIIYTAFEAGSIYFRNLRSQVYFSDLEKQGVSTPKTLLWKCLISCGTVFVYCALGALEIGLSSLVFFNMYPDEKEKFIEKMSSDGQVLVGPLDLLNYLLIAFAAMVLVYCVVSLTYAFFLKQRLSGISATIFYFIIGGALVRYAYQLPNKNVTGTRRTLTEIAISCGLILICYFGTLLLIEKKIFPKTEETAGL